MEIEGQHLPFGERRSAICARRTQRGSELNSQMRARHSASSLTACCKTFSWKRILRGELRWEDGGESSLTTDTAGGVGLSGSPRFGRSLEVVLQCGDLAGGRLANGDIDMKCTLGDSIVTTPDSRRGSN